jgi:hypothetical protein
MGMKMSAQKLDICNRKKTKKFLYFTSENSKNILSVLFINSLFTTLRAKFYLNKSSEIK